MTPDSSDGTQVRPGLFSHTEVELPAYRIRWLARLLYGDPFEFLVIAVILANAIALAILTFTGVNPIVEAIARAIDQWAIYFYSAELVLRILSYGRRPWMFFRNPWNVFDFVIVLAIPLLNNGTVIFRLVRLLRTLRIFRFLPEARILVLSVVKSVAPLANLAVLIAFLMFIYGMAGVYFFGPADPERWGDIGRAMLTLTIAPTLANFQEILLEGIEITPFALPYFVSYLFFIVFTVLNVLIGIVLTAMDQAREEVAQNADEPAQRTSPDDELQALRKRLAELEAGYKVSPDHLRRIREELDRLTSG